MKHVGDLLGQEWKGPTEEVKAFWQLIGRLRVGILFQLQVIILQDKN